MMMCFELSSLHPCEVSLLLVSGIIIEFALRFVMLQTLSKL